MLEEFRHLFPHTFCKRFHTCIVIKLQEEPCEEDRVSGCVHKMSPGPAKRHKHGFLRHNTMRGSIPLKLRLPNLYGYSLGEDLLGQLMSGSYCGREVILRFIINDMSSLSNTVSRIRSLLFDACTKYLRELSSDDASWLCQPFAKPSRPVAQMAPKRPDQGLVLLFEHMAYLVIFCKPYQPACRQREFQLRMGNYNRHHTGSRRFCTNLCTMDTSL